MTRGAGEARSMSEGGARLSARVVEFMQHEVARLNRNVASEHFTRVVSAVERAYDAALAAVPQPLGTARDIWIAHAVLLCHRSFLVAVSLIGRGHPDDAVGTNRRALETAKVAFAVRHDEANWTAWAAYEERMKRWTDRQKGVKPERVSPQLKLPQDHALLGELGTWLGMLSDTLHFTPEFAGSHELQPRPGELFLSYFTDDAVELDHAVRCLAAVQVLILRVLDEAFSGAFTRSPAWCDAMQALFAAGLDLARQAGVPGTE